MHPRLLVLLVGFACLIAGSQAQLAADNVIVAFNNAAQDEVRTAGIQNQLSAKVRSSYPKAVN